MIHNGSFEVGSSGWAPPFWISESITDEVACDGSRSLKLEGFYQYSAVRTRSAIKSQLIRLETGRYTLSFYAASRSSSNRLQVGVTSTYEDGGRREIASQRFRSLGRPWNKYSIPFEYKKQGKGHSFVYFKPGIAGRRGSVKGKGNCIWIDNVRLTPDRDMDTVAYSVDFGCRDGSNGIYERNEKVELVSEIYDPDNSSSSYTINFKIYDYYGRRAAAWSKKISGDEGPHIRDVSQWSPDALGVYRIRATLVLDNGQEYDSETSVSVLPPVRTGQGSSSPFGTHVIFHPELLQITRRIGFQWIRLHDFSPFTKWSIVEPEKGTFQWFDKEITLLHSMGFNILGSLNTIPYWASRGNYKSKKEYKWDLRGAPPRDLKEFENYVYKTVSHYKDRIRFWEIWNEPFHRHYWSGSVKKFVDLMRAAYESAKKADPTCKIVAPASNYGQILAVLKLGGHRYFDILSYHFYFPNSSKDRTFGAEIGRVKRLKKWMRKNNVEKPIWNSEGGLITSSLYRAFLPGESKWLRKFITWSIYDYKRPSELIVKWYVINYSEGVEKSFYYYTGEDGKGYYDKRESDWALLEYDRRPKPLGVALSMLNSKLGDRFRFYGKGKREFGEMKLHFFIFERQTTPLVVFWCKKEMKQVPFVDPAKQIIVSFPGERMKISNLMGNAVRMPQVEGGAAFPVTSEPHYLETKEKVAPEVLHKLFSASH